MVIQLYRPYTGDDQNPWVVRRSMHQLKDSWNRVGVQTFFLQSSENRLVGGIFRGSTSNQMGCPSFNPRKISAISWFTPFFWRSATPPPRERPVVLAMAHTHTFFFSGKMWRSPWHQSFFLSLMKLRCVVLRLRCLWSWSHNKSPTADEDSNKSQEVLLCYSYL